MLVRLQLRLRGILLLLLLSLFMLVPDAMARIWYTCLSPDPLVVFFATVNSRGICNYSERKLYPTRNVCMYDDDVSPRDWRYAAIRTPCVSKPCFWGCVLRTEYHNITIGFLYTSTLNCDRDRDRDHASTSIRLCGLQMITYYIVLSHQAAW